MDGFYPRVVPCLIPDHQLDGFYLGVVPCLIPRFRTDRISADVAKAQEPPVGSDGIFVGHGAR